MALKSFRDRNPAILGIASVLTIALALVAVFLTGKLGLLQDRYAMSGIFGGTGGLSSGNEVRIAGIKVGEVTSVKPDFGKGYVLVTWEVDHGVDLGLDTRADISTSNILGGRYLRLSGPVSRPYMADVPASRRRIPEERTQLPITTNDLVATGAKTLQRLDTKTIGEVIDKIGGMTPQTRRHLTDALHKLAQIADTLQQSGPQLKTLVTSSSKLLTTVKSRDAQLVRLGQGIQVLLNQLRERQAELTVLLGSGSRTVTRISDLIDKQQQGLINLMTDLGGTVSSISAQQDDMNNLLAWLGPSMYAFSTAGSYGPFLDAAATQLGPVSVADLARLAGQKGAGK